MDLDEVAHYEPPHQDLRCFANSAIFVHPVMIYRMKYSSLLVPLQIFFRFSFFITFAYLDNQGG